jgi:hypothetical protein
MNKNIETTNPTRNEKLELIKEIYKKLEVEPDKSIYFPTKELELAEEF